MLSEKTTTDSPIVNTGNSNAVDKILNVIDCIFEQELSFTDIKNKLNIPKATLHRILLSLENNDFVEKDPLTDKYRLGMKFIYYGENLKSRLTLIGIAENSVKELAKLTDESVYLSVLYEHFALNILSAAGDESALTSKLVPISSLNCSASGKLFLSMMSDEEIASYFAGDSWTRRTVNSICSAEDFLKEKKKIQATGLSFDNEEYEYGLYCMTAPLSNHSGKITASIGVSGPLARMQMKNMEFLQSQLWDKATEISEVLTRIKYEPEY